MAKKEIKWGNKELPGLSFDELNKITTRSLVASETGKHNVESGHLAKISIEGGKTTGKQNNENGTMKKCIQASTSNKDLQSNKGKKGGSITGQKEWTCPHCTKTGSGPAMTRFHMDNCTIWQPFEALPNDMSFTIKQVMVYLNKNGFDMTFSNAKQFLKNHPLIQVDGITIGGVSTKYKKILKQSI